MSSWSAESAARRVEVGRLGLRRDALALSVMVLTALAVVLPTVLKGEVWIDGDLAAFYWPTMQVAFEAVRRGELPLWSPNMLGGFPLYADGSVGTLFPLNWVLVVWPHALMLIPLGRILLAAIGMYAFLRVLHLGPAAGAVGGLVFALNSFGVAHASHIDLNNGTAMLPYTLLAAEMSLRAAGWRRQALWLLAAGVAHGLAWVSLHPMAPLMILPVYAGWVVYRGWGERRRVGLKWAVVALILPLALAIALSAAQTLPMYELGMQSPRQTAGARFNASFSLPPYDLIGLVWPTFFHSAHGGVQWGLWNHETLTFLGTLPLVLILVAVAARPLPRHALFFGVAAVLALWTAFGLYAPIGPQPLLYSLPGYNVLRAPARFFFVVGFAGAALAAMGLEWLAGQRMATIGRGPRRVLVALAIVAVLIPAVALIGLTIVNGLPRQAERAAWVLYLRLPHGTPLRAEDVLYALREKLALTNLEMWKAAGLLLGSVGLIGAWLRGRLSLRAFQVAAVAVVAVDLAVLATQFVTPRPLERVVEPRPVVEYMMGRLDGGRFYNTTPVDASLVHLPFGLPDFNGQSSLMMARPAAYAAAGNFRETSLFDLAAVRYIMQPRNVRDERQWHAAVAYRRDQPLVTIYSDTLEKFRVFRAPATPVRTLRLLAALAEAVEVPQGKPVAEVTIESRGRVTSLPIRAGIEVSEWAAERPDVTPQLRHGLAAPAVSWKDRDATGQTYTKHLFLVELPLAEPGAEPLVVERLRITMRDERAGLVLMGATLVDAETGAVVSLTRYHLARYTLEYEDRWYQLYRSATTLPRAHLVGQALHYPHRWQSLDRLKLSSFDPLRRMTLEGDYPPAAGELVVAGPTDRYAPLPPAPEPDTLGEVRIVEEDSTTVILAATVRQPAFLVLSDTHYPGWTARVGDEPADVLLANYKFRAVYLPPGTHTVTFEFEPQSVRLGMAITLVTIGILAVGVIVLSRKPR